MPAKLRLLCATLFISLGANATSYYISNDGNDVNTGTIPSSPWKTLNKVNNWALHPGDSVLLKRGDVWREQMNLSYSGAIGNPITYGSYGVGAKPIIDGTEVLTGPKLLKAGVYAYVASHIGNQLFVNNARYSRHSGAGPSVSIGEWDVVAGTVYVNSASDLNTQTVEVGIRQSNFYLVGASYIVIDSIDLEKSDGFGIGAYGGSQDLTIQNSKISYAWKSNIESGDLSYRQDNPIIVNNEVSFGGGLGIDVSRGCNGGLIAGNLVHENGAMLYAPGSPIEHLYNAGIKIWGNQSDMQNVVIKNNNVWGNGRAGQTWSGGIGIWVDEAKSGNIVTANLVHDNATAGIVVEATSGTTVSYNTVYANNLISGSAGIQLSRYGSNNQIYHNTSNLNIVGIAIQGTPGGYGQFVNNIVRNNIAVGNLSRQLRATGGGENAYGSTGNFYSANAFGVASLGFVEWGQNNLKDSYAAWELAYGKATNSVQSNPLIGNPGGALFTLHAGADY